mmetsp:Transcript_10628/g.13906  ORF Transcript_10628/g.13906 Transcript_10628/m.13906 type:complete len:213 (-) Transcript_10628:833-1471(-)
MDIGYDVCKLCCEAAQEAGFFVFEQEAKKCWKKGCELKNCKDNFPCLVGTAFRTGLLPPEQVDSDLQRTTYYCQASGEVTAMAFSERSTQFDAIMQGFSPGGFTVLILFVFFLGCCYGCILTKCWAKQVNDSKDLSKDLPKDLEKTWASTPYNKAYSMNRPAPLSASMQEPTESNDGEEEEEEEEELPPTRITRIPTIDRMEDGRFPSATDL